MNFKKQCSYRILLFGSQLQLLFQLFFEQADHHFPVFTLQRVQLQNTSSHYMESRGSVGELRVRAQASLGYVLELGGKFLNSFDITFTSHKKRTLANR